MNAFEDEPNSPKPSSGRWPLLALAFALIWVALVRVPLVLNARDHLDSDLAVDGLTLIEAMQGHWRWHYPGTPYIGTGPVLLSLPAAKLFGANASTLVTGGVAAYMLLVIFTFCFVRRAFGSGPAMWSLVPLAFASTGTVWLSGRITGGHLVTAAWHAGALLLLYELIRRGGVFRALILGLWCGLGLYLDRMFLLTVAAVAAAGVGSWFGGGCSRMGLAAAFLFFVGFLLGYSPHVRGLQTDSRDAYEGQFQTILAPQNPVGPPKPIDWKTVRKLAAEHARILGLDALPRLIAGHRLPGLESEPHPNVLSNQPLPRNTFDAHPLSTFATLVSLGLFLASVIAVVRGPAAPESLAAVACRWVMLATGAITLVGFVLNRNIFNSDNYRYLVVLLVLWPAGFGLLMDRLYRGADRRKRMAIGLSCMFAILMTLDTIRWYSGFGWVRGGVVPVRVERPEPALAWLNGHPEVDAFFGGYWDVYRLSFLTGGRVKGVPYPVFPNRFPEWSAGIPAHQPRILITRRTPEGLFYRRAAIRAGARELFQDHDYAIFDWPR
jgi:hypothetical protein